MKKLRILFHYNNLFWLGAFTYVVLPTFKIKGRRFSKRLNKIWFDSLAIIVKTVSESSADFMNYGYIDTAECEIKDIEETPRNMYRYIATNNNQERLYNKNLLEIGCGKGVGGLFLKKETKLENYVGIDLSDEHIKIAKEKFNFNNSTFLQGDAENLPIGEEIFDYVLNIESSHQYPTVDKFYKEVKRVLKEDGKFMYADFFDDNEVEKCEEAALNAGLKMQYKNHITENVRWALEKTNKIKIEKIESQIPKRFHPFIKEWAGTVDSPLYKMLKEGKRHYIHYVYTN